MGSFFSTNKVERVLIEGCDDITCENKDKDLAITLPLVDSEQSLEMKYEIQWGGGGAAGGTNGTSGGLGNSTAQGSQQPISGQFTGYTDTDLTLKAIVDATGVLNVPGTGGVGLDKIKYKEPDISEYLAHLKKVVYDFRGEAHTPPYVRLTWGKIFNSSSTMSDTKGVFKGKLKSMTIKYELFSATGNPVKAEVTLVFQSAINPGKTSVQASPDLTHIVEVKYGDNLPAMCQKIYNSPSYYLQVAKVNNLMSAFALEPGMKLVFPPLEKTSR